MAKLLSRKLGVTVATILTVVLQIEDPTRAGIVGAVAIAYVISQALVDKSDVERITKAVEEGINEGREVSDEEDA